MSNDFRADYLESARVRAHRYGTPRDFSSSEDLGENWDDSGFYSSRSTVRSSREGLPPAAVPTPFIADGGRSAHEGKLGGYASYGGGSAHAAPHGKPPLRAASYGAPPGQYRQQHYVGGYEAEQKYREVPRRPHTAGVAGYPPPHYNQPSYPPPQHYHERGRVHPRGPPRGSGPPPRSGQAGALLRQAAFSAQGVGNNGGDPYSQRRQGGGLYYHEQGEAAEHAVAYDTHASSYGMESSGYAQSSEAYHAHAGDSDRQHPGYFQQNVGGNSEHGAYNGVAEGGYYAQETAPREPGPAPYPQGISEEDVADIFSMARHNRYDEVEALLDRGVPVNVRDKHGNTVLAVACQNGLKRLAKLALRRGGDINSTNNKGNTPLHFCFTYGYGDTLGAYLITKGADPSIRNEYGQTCYEGVGKK